MARCRPSGAFALVLLLLAAPLLSFAPTATAAEANEEGKLPVHMVGASAVFLDGASYVLGGRKDDGTYSDAIYKYDHATGAVTQAGKLPSGRQSGAAVLLSGKIYYFGGAVLTNAGDLNNDGSPEYVPRATADVLRWDPRTGGTATTLLTKLPAGAWGLMATTIGTKAYVIGGFSFDFARPDAIDRKDSIFEFDGDSLRSVSRIPYALQDGAIAALGNRIYLFGGLSDHHAELNPCPTYPYYNEDTGQYEDKQPTACLTDNILRFDPASGVTVPAGKLPYRAQFLHAGVVSGKAYIAGGALSGPTATASIVEFNPSSSEPTRLLTPTLPTGAYGAPATSDGKVLTYFGGRTGGYSELSDSIVRIQPGATAPWAPRALSVTAGASAISLAWEPPAYDGGSPITHYRVYRVADSGEEVALGNATGGALQFADSTAAPGASYVYRVTSVNAAGESTRDARATTKAEETVPGAVEYFEASPGDRQVVLRWLPPLTTGGLNLSGYRVYRDDVLVHSPPPGSTRWTDTGLENGVAYAYTIRPYNAKGSGPAQGPLSATPLPVPPAPDRATAEAVAGGAVRVAWSEPASGLYDGYVVLRGTEPKHLTEIARLSERAYEDAAVEQGRTYYYAVQSYNELGESPPTELVAVSLVTPPGAPVNLIVSPGQGEIRLTWQTPDDTGGADPKSLVYQITRGDASGQNTRIIATEVKGASYIDRFVSPGATYTYTIAAMNPLLGASSPAKTGTARAVTNELPQAVLAALPPIAKAGDLVELDASQSNDLDGQIKAYRFNFGDGSPEVTTDRASVQHAYSVNGTYYATVVAIDNRGGESPVASAQVVVGDLSGPLTDPTGLGNVPVSNADGTPASRPGTKAPTPGPGALAALAGVAIAALVAGRRRRA